MDAPVCVTGASGFIAAHIVSDLLDAGYKVRGTVRDASSSKYEYLTSMDGAEERLELVYADLLEPTSFDAAVEGCEYVLHTASPYVFDVEDPQRDLVDPAVEGTRGVMKACCEAGTVKRVVVTSSMAAITDEPDENQLLTEDDWNDRSSLTRNPYYYSKTQAEREAWKFAEDDDCSFDVVAINPFVVIGPAHSPRINTSNRIFADIMNGVYPAIMSLSWGFVDVRDVARAHRLAMETPEASGRYICANETMSMRDVVELLKAEGYGNYRLPTVGLDNPAGDVLARLGSYSRPRGIGSYLRTHVGRTPRFDNSKIIEELDIDFRPLKKTLRDTVVDLVHWGHVKVR